LETLSEIGAAHTPQILVLNKADLIPGGMDAAALARRILSDPEHQPAGAVAVSALSGEGLDKLSSKIDETLPVDPVSACMFRIPAAEGAPLHLLHEYGRVISTQYNGDFCEVEAETPDSLRRRLAKYLVSVS